MRSRSIVSLTIAAVLIAMLAFAPMATYAQEGAGTGTQCDSTLMLLVLLAQQSFNYQPAMDITGFNRGQFSTYFDEWAQMTGSIGQAGATEEAAQAGATEEAGQAGQTGQTATEEAGQAGQTATEEAGQMAFTPLNPPMITDEDVNCGALRADVESFVTSQLQGGMRPGTATQGMGGGQQGTSGG
jgi:hypothetical protein